MIWKHTIYRDLAAALKGEKGKTLQALAFVAEWLYADETPQWITTASGNAAWSWEDGMLVVTDQRVLLGTSDAQETRYVSTSRDQHFPLRRFRGPADAKKLVTVDLSPLLVHGAIISEEAYSQLQALLRR